MAGHSHWAGIKHKKAAIDNKRGKLWSKLSKAIIAAARAGGGDISMNLSLRYAIQDAKDVSMPKDNITRAIKKGTGELEGGQLDEIVYEGYAPAGVAIMCDVLTDNRNRTAPELRNMFERIGGNLGATGCVAWMFDRKGLFLIDSENAEEETLMELVLEAGADDVVDLDGEFQITCPPEAFQDVKQKLAEADVPTTFSKIDRIPKETVEIEGGDAKKVIKLMELLDDHDDVQSVSANFSISEDAMAQLSDL